MVTYVFPNAAFVYRDAAKNPYKLIVVAEREIKHIPAYGAYPSVPITRVQRTPMRLQMMPEKNPPTVITPKTTALATLDKVVVSSPAA
jgi:hypothetical protein